MDNNIDDLLEASKNMPAINSDEHKLRQQEITEAAKPTTLKQVADEKQATNDITDRSILNSPVISAVDGAGYAYYKARELTANAGVAVHNLMSKDKVDYLDYSKDYSSFEKKVKERDIVGADVLTAPIVAGMEAAGKTVHSTADSAAFLYYKGKGLVTGKDTSEEYAKAEKAIRQNEADMSGGAEQLQDDIAKKLLGRKEQSITGDVINSRATAETVSMIYEYANAASIAKTGVIKGAKLLGKTATLTSGAANAAMVAPTLAVKQAVFNDADHETMGNFILNSMDKDTRETFLGHMVEALSINEDDTAFEKRLKQVGAELPLGTLFEAVLPVGKSIYNYYKDVKAAKVKDLSSLDEIINHVESSGIPNENNVLLKSVQQNLKEQHGIDKSLDDLAKTADDLKIPVVKSNGDVNADMINEYTGFYKDVYHNGHNIPEGAELEAALKNSSKQADEVVPAIPREQLVSHIDDVASKLKSTLLGSTGADVEAKSIEEAFNNLKTTLSSSGVEVSDDVLRSTLNDIKNADTKELANKIVGALDENNVIPKVSAGNKANAALAAGGLAAEDTIKIEDDDSDSTKVLKYLALAASIGAVGVGAIRFTNKYRGKTQNEVIADASSLRNKIVTNPLLMDKIAGVVRKDKNSLNVADLKLSPKEKQIANDLNNVPPVTQGTAEVLDGMNTGQKLNQVQPNDFESHYAILNSSSSGDEFTENIGNIVFGENYAKKYQSNQQTIAMADIKDAHKAFGLKDASDLQTKTGDIPVELVRMKRLQDMYSQKLTDSSKELFKLNSAIEQANKTGRFEYENLTLSEAQTFKAALQLQWEKDFNGFTYMVDLSSQTANNIGRSLQIMNRSVDVSMNGTLQAQYLKGLKTDMSPAKMNAFVDAIVNSSKDGHDILSMITISKMGKIEKTVEAIMYMRLAGLLSSPKTLGVNTLGGIGMIAKDSIIDYGSALITRPLNNGVRSIINKAFGTKMHIDEDGITFGEANLKAHAKFEAFGDLISGIKELNPTNLKEKGIVGVRNQIAEKVAGNKAPTSYIDEGMQQEISSGARTMKPFENFFVNPQTDFEKAAAPLVHGLGTAIGTPLEIMKATDQLVYGIQFRAELASQAYKKAYQEIKAGTLSEDNLAGRLEFLRTNPTDDMVGTAYEASKKATFQQDLTKIADNGENVTGLIGKLGSSANNFKHAHPIIGRIAFPFVKTPTNITIETLESTPLGLVPGLTRSRKEWIRIMKEGGEESQRLVTNIALGSSIIGYGMHLYSQGQFSADDGYGKGVLSNTEDMIKAGNINTNKTGVKSYSLKVGDKYYNVARESTFGTLLQIGAQFQYAMDRGASRKEMDHSVIGGLLASSKVMEDKAFAQGFVDLINALSNVQKQNNSVFERYAENQASTFVPFGGLGRDLNNVVDPDLKEFHEFFDKAKAKTFGVKGSLYTKRDIITGDPVKNQNFSWWNPFEASEQSHSGLIQHLDDIGYVPRILPKTINGVKLNGEEYDKLQQYVTRQKIDGKTLKDHLLEIVNDPDYAELPDGEVLDYDGTNERIATGSDFKPQPNTKQSVIDKAFAAYRDIGLKNFMVNEKRGKDIFVNKNIGKVLADHKMEYGEAKRYLENEFLNMVKEQE